MTVITLLASNSFTLMFSNQLAWSHSAAPPAQHGDAEIHPKDERLTGDAADFDAHVKRELFNS